MVRTSQRAFNSTVGVQITFKNASPVRLAFTLFFIQVKRDSNLLSDAADIVPCQGRGRRLLKLCFNSFFAHSSYYCQKRTKS